MSQDCVVTHCCHSSTKNDCKMFSFPSNEALRRIWAKKLSLNAGSNFPFANSSVCSCHFVGGAIPVSDKSKRKQIEIVKSEGEPTDKKMKQIYIMKKDENKLNHNSQAQELSAKQPLKIKRNYSPSKFPSVTLVKAEDPLKTEFSLSKYTDIIEVSEAPLANKEESTIHKTLSVSEVREHNNATKVSLGKDGSFIIEEKPDADLENVTILLLEPSKRSSAPKKVSTRPAKRGRKTKYSLSKIDPCYRHLEEDQSTIQIDSMVPSPEGLDQIVETDVGKTDEERLSEEHKRLASRLDKLKIKMKEVSAIKSYQKERLTITKLESNPDLLNFYTGIKSLDNFYSIVKDVNNHAQCEKQPHLDVLKIEEQLLLTLMELWRNFLKEDLAFRFRINVSQAEEIIYSLILILHELYYCKLPCNDGFLYADVVLEQIYEDAILAPSSHSSNCRVIIDCIKTYCSDEKIDDNHETSDKDEKFPYKGFIAITPQKSVIFTSNLFPETKNTLDVFESYGILCKVLDGKMILSDNCLGDNDQYIKDELNELHKIDKRIRSINSKVRLHIGKVTMCHIKRYAILNHIPSFLGCIASKVYQLCSGLVNLQSSFSQD